MQHQFVYRTFAIALLGLTSGCYPQPSPTRAQMEAQAITANNQSAQQQSIACSYAVYDSPEYSVVRPHRPFNLSDATIQQMTDTSYVTDSETQALTTTYPKYKNCHNAFLNELSQATPSVVPIITNYYTKSDDTLLALIQKKITWGVYIQTLKDMAPQYQADINAEYQRINQGLYQEQEAEMAQRRAAALALSQYLQNQQMINTLNQPVITNCTQSGYSTNCVSQ
jgi:hypothetical protein